MADKIRIKLKKSVISCNETESLRKRLVPKKDWRDKGVRKYSMC